MVIEKRADLFARLGYEFLRFVQFPLCGRDVQVLEGHTAAEALLYHIPSVIGRTLIRKLRINRTTKESR